MILFKEVIGLADKILSAIQRSAKGFEPDWWPHCTPSIKSIVEDEELDTCQKIYDGLLEAFPHITPTKEEVLAFLESIKGYKIDLDTTIVTIFLCRSFIQPPALNDHIGVANIHSLFDYVQDDVDEDEDELDEFLDPFGTCEMFRNWIVNSNVTTSYFSKTGSKNYHSPHFTLIQRSGSGKTALLHESGKHLPLLYISMLKSPKVIVDYLKSCKKAHQFSKLVYACAIFMDLAYGCRRDGFCEWFSNLFKPTSKACIGAWTLIVDLANRMVFRNNVLQYGTKCSISISDTVTIGPLPSTTTNLSNMLQNLPNFGKIVLAIDDARALLAPTYEESPFKSIRKDLTKLHHPKRFCVVFADSDPRLAGFHPTFSTDSTIRYDESRKYLIPPFFMLSNHDLFAKEYFNALGRNIYKDNWLRFLQDRSNPEEELARLLLQLGSPMWRKTLDTGTVEGLVNFATGKLGGASEKLSMETLIASLACRINLRISPHSDLPSRLVSHHQAHLDYINKNGRRTFCSYPSDPALSCAATKILLKHGTDALEALVVQLDEASVMVPDAGEVAAQILLLSAIDHAISRSNDQMDNLLRIVKVKDFLTSLFGTQHSHEFGKVLGDARFLEASVWFNHFISLDTSPDYENIQFLISRGAAGSFLSQHGVEMVIPVVHANGLLSIIAIIVNNCAMVESKCAVIDQIKMVLLFAEENCGGEEIEAKKAKMEEFETLGIYFNFLQGQESEIFTVSKGCAQNMIFSEGFNRGTFLNIWNNSQDYSLESFKLVQDLLRPKNPVKKLLRQEYPSSITSFFDSQDHLHESRTINGF